MARQKKFAYESASLLKPGGIFYRGMWNSAPWNRGIECFIFFHGKIMG